MIAAARRLEALQAARDGSISRDVGIVKPDASWPEKYDVANLIKDGWSAARVLQYIERSVGVDAFEQHALGPAERIRVEVARLAKLDRADYLAERKPLAKSLNIPASELDRLVARGQNASNIRTGSPQTLGAEGVGDCSNGCSNAPPVRTLEELYGASRDIVESSDVLKKVDGAILSLGYAGDRNPVLLTYVVLSSRLLDKPINEHVIAQSASGKNHTVNTALVLVPEEAVFKMTASTPKALIYSEEDLRHKTVVMSECDSLLALEGNAASLVRSIIEDARTDYDVVEKDPETGRNFTRRVSKEGPTGLITTGVHELEFQTSTRMLNVYLSDSPEQTRLILKAEAAIANGRSVAVPADLIAKFLDFQRWLAAQPSSAVIVPFAGILADEIPAGEVRMRRDFKQLLAVIKAIALLNQHHRERDPSGRIVADLVDYNGHAPSAHFVPLDCRRWRYRCHPADRVRCARRR